MIEVITKGNGLVIQSCTAPSAQFFCVLYARFHLMLDGKIIVYLLYEISHIIIILHASVSFSQQTLFRDRNMHFS